ncbi:hypothetical protein [Streptomyces sp. NPDC002746]
MRPGTRVTDALLGRDGAGLALALLPAAVGTWRVTVGAGWCPLRLTAALDLRVKQAGDRAPAKHVWHCSVRTAPCDRRFSDSPRPGRYQHLAEEFERRLAELWERA